MAWSSWNKKVVKYFTHTLKITKDKERKLLMLKNVKYI